MEKGCTETFKEYAQRWKDVAVQAEPSLTERETIFMFLNTLRMPYYKMLLASAPRSLSNLVMVGELIEKAIKIGKIKSEEDTRAKRNPNEDEEQVIGQDVQQLEYLALHHPYTTYQPYHSTMNQDSCIYPPVPPACPFFDYSHNQPIFQTNSHDFAHAQISMQMMTTRSISQPTIPPNKQKGHKSYQEKHKFDPILITYTKLLPQLLQRQLLNKVQVEPLKSAYPEWYDDDAQCEYHMKI